MKTITIDLHNGEQLLLVGVPMDTYRFDLIKNKELKHRYGKLEYTTREKGHERYGVSNNFFMWTMIVMAVIGLIAAWLS